MTEAAAEAGVDPEHAELTARTLVYYVLGFTVDEQSRLQWDAAGADLPDSQSVLADDANARFRFGVDLLVNGIGAHASLSDVATNVADVITVDDVRRISVDLAPVLRGRGARRDQVPRRTACLRGVFAR